MIEGRHVTMARLIGALPHRRCFAAGDRLAIAPSAAAVDATSQESLIAGGMDLQGIEFDRRFRRPFCRGL